MKKVLLCLGLLLICIALLGGGLLPGAWIIAADSSPDESYTLDGVARYAVLVTGLCEFILGAGFAFGVCCWRKRKTE